MDSYKSFEGLHFICKDRLPGAIEGVKLATGVSRDFDGHSKQRVFSDVHFHASPEGLRGLVVPRVDDARSDMFAFRCCLLYARSFADVYGKVGLGSRSSINIHYSEAWKLLYLASTGLLWQKRQRSNSFCAWR